MSRHPFACIVCLGIGLGGVFHPRASAATAGSVCLNEAVSFNDSGLTDEDGSHPDWIELFNGGNQSINLRG